MDRRGQKVGCRPATENEAPRPSVGRGGQAAPGPSSAKAPVYVPMAKKPLPSSKLMVPCADVFAKPKDGSTPFSIAYAAGVIPCRVNHGSVRHTLQWSQQPGSLPFDPLLVLCAEGLRETVHPHNFVAPTAFVELCRSQGAAEKVLPLLQQLQTPIRLALMSKDKHVFASALTAVNVLAEIVGPALIDCVGSWLVPLGKLNGSSREEARNTLGTLEQFGGPGVRALIKAKVPSYVSVR